jgi:hypothetical protein
VVRGGPGSTGRISGPDGIWAVQRLEGDGARVSLADRGLTVGTSTRGGVRIRLRQPIGALVPGKLLAHPAVTVTVDEPAELVRLLRPGRWKLRNVAGRMLQPGRTTVFS